MEVQPDLSDEKLIAACLAGDDNAFKTLVRRYEPRIAATVIGMLGMCAEAKDIGQETFFRFYKGMQNFRGDASVGTYLIRIAINLSLDELKRRKRRSRMFFRKETEELADIPDDNVQNPYSGEKEIMHRAIQQLEPPFRSVVVLRLIDGYTTKETAEILNIPMGTVLSRLARAQNKLKKSLLPLMEETAS